MLAPTGPRSRLALRAAVAVATVLVAAACSGDDSDAGDSTPTSTGPTVPAGMTLPGETLEVGATATVHFEGQAPRWTSRVELTVTKVRQGRIAALKQFSLDDSTRRSSVYYVDAAVRNVGNGNLSGETLTLFGKVSDELVVPPAILGSPFPPCHDHPFPPRFTRGKATKVCLVMFAPQHGTVSQVQWRGPEEEPIAWAVG